MFNRKKFNNFSIIKIFINNGIKVDLYYYDNKTSENMSNTTPGQLDCLMTVLSF